jgi:chitinase
LPSHFDTLGFTLRTHYETASKHYYLSSAPQCPFPDASDPPALLLLCDFVWVQFYNNPPCEIGSAGFDASIKQWSAALEASTLVSKPRLYVGAPAFSEAGVSAYAHIGNAEGMMGIANSVEKMGLNNFGGVMFWDGPEGMLNLEGGKDIISWAKEGLHS